MGAVPMHQKTTVGFAPTTERRHAVLLCTELRGLARMSEALEPSLVLLLANEFFAFASDIVAAHSGEAITSQHEMMLSAFTRGNPLQISQQAVRAAQRVQADFPALADRWRTTYGLRSWWRRGCIWARQCSASRDRGDSSAGLPSATASTSRNPW